MKKLFFTFFLALSLCGIVYAQNNNVIEPELQTILNQKNSGLIDLSISFKSEFNAKILSQKTRNLTDKTLQKEIIVGELKSFTEEAQADVLSILKAEELNGNVTDINSLWIANSISCKATASVIYKLASHPDVKALVYDKEIQLISPEQMKEFKAVSANVRGNYPQVTSVNADDVWNLGYTGKNVVVAVLDSGTNTNHIDLKDHLWKGFIDTDKDGTPDTYVNGWNFTVNNGGNSDIIDEFGHGTHCAGIVCGDGTSLNNTGIAPDALLMTVKTVGRSGTGSVAQMLSGVQFAVENGADILSMSLGFKNSQITTAQKEEIRFAFDNVLAAGVVVCAAAGNDGDTYGAPHNVDYPAACPAPWRNPDQTLTGGLSSVICVGAHDLGMSSRGPSTWEGTAYNDYPYNEGASMGLIRPDISAMGNMIYSSNHSQNDKYAMKSGTSQATPCVAGVIALMLEKNSTLTPAQISQIIEETAQSKPAKKDNIVGAGVVDALAAVNSITETVGNPYVKVTAFAPKSMATGNRTLSITLKNEGAGASDDNTSVTLSLSNDPYVTIENPTQTLGRLGVNVDKTLFFELNIDENTPSGHTATFSVKTTGGTYNWEETYSVQITAVPNLAFQSVSPGLVNTNATTDIKVTMINNGTADFTGPITLKLVTTNYDLKYVTLIDNETTIPALGVGETGTGTFTIETKTPTYPYDFFLETYSESTTGSNYIYEFENDMEGWTYLSGSYYYKAPWLHSTEAGTYKIVGESNSGKGHLMSISIIDGTLQQNNSIDNYLVSPTKIKVGENTKVSFYARANNSYYYKEHFGFAVSTAGNTSVSDFTTIQEWVITDRTTWKKYTVDLSEYYGQEIYVAIRHFFPNQEWIDSGYGQDLDALDIDDIIFENVIVNTEYKSTLSSDDPYYFNVTASSNPNLPMVGAITATPMSGAVSLEWVAVNGVSKYGIYRNGHNIATVTEPSYVDKNLSYNEEYCYAVTTIKSYESGFSDEVCATTLGPDAKPLAPANLFAEAISNSEIVLAWDAVAGANSYKVCQGTEVIASEITETTYTVTGLNAQTNYCFNVIAVNEIGDSEMSEEACATTFKDKPAAPANLNAEATSDSEIVLTWDVATGASTYKVYQGNDMIKSGITETTYTVTDLNAQTNYCFNVIAVNETGESEISEEACETTMRAKPAAPANLNAEAKGYSEIVLTWNEAAGANSYKVCQGTDVIASEITETTYTVSGLNAQTNYCFNVVAVNETGESEMSNSACAITGKEPTGIIVKSFELATHKGATTLTATLINKTTSDVPATAMAVAKLSCDDTYVTINNGVANVGAIAVGATTDVTFDITIADNIPFDHVLNFDITVEYQVSGMGGTENLTYTFDNDLEGFTTITKDDHTWYHSSNQSAHGYNKTYKTTPSGMGFIFSESYCNKGSGFDPDHWIVLPEQIIPSDLTTIEFYACSMANQTTYADETFGVFVSTTSNTDVNTFEKVGNGWTLAKNSNSLKMALKSEMLIDYEDQKIWVAIRHYGAGDNAALAIDDVTIYNVKKEVNNNVEDTSSFSITVNSSTNTFSGIGTWNDASNWSKGSVPTAEEDVVINGDVTIENGDITVKSLTINNEKSLTVNEGVKLTVVSKFVSPSVSSLIINDGAQICQTSENVPATFMMKIENPEVWAEANKTGWQFISSPLKNSEFESFIPETDDYDLYLFDGSKEYEWANYKSSAASFGTDFQQGRAYLASYEAETTATFSGVLNKSTSFEYEVSYNVDKELANFHLLGNPFTFDMEWSGITAESLVDGYAVVNNEGGYNYLTSGTIKVGDGFFVKAIGENASLSYTHNARSSQETANCINVIVAGKAGKDNVVVNFAGQAEGFNKLQNFNDAIATVYVSENGKNYGIANVDENTTEVAVNFDAKEMGSYTISLDVNGEFETVTLVDRFTGVETNMLLEDEYTFTATGNDNVNRFVIKLDNGKQTTVNGQFVYKNGEELILSIEGSVQIVDMLGRVVYSNEHANGDNRINVADFNDASYVVRVINEEGVKVQKVVIY